MIKNKMEEKKELKVTLAIAAYDAEANIKSLLYSLISQKGINKQLEQILVYSDASVDATVEKAKEVVDKRIKIIDSRKRTGFAGAVKNILARSSSDVIVLLNDDIKITGNYFIKRLISPFMKEDNVGLVAGNPQPMKPNNIIEGAVISSFRAYEKMRYSLKNGDNKFTCDGKVLALAGEFAKGINFPKDYKKLGNVDIYLYFSCLKNGYKYRHVKSAKVYYRCPSTVKDYISWTIRNNSNRHILRQTFGEIVDREYRKPSRLNYYKFIEFLKNPVGALFIFLTSFYVSVKARAFAKEFDPLWEIVNTTKNLN